MYAPILRSVDRTEAVHSASIKLMTELHNEDFFFFVVTYFIQREMLMNIDILLKFKERSYMY